MFPKKRNNCSWCKQYNHWTFIPQRAGICMTSLITDIGNYSFHLCLSFMPIIVRINETIVVKWKADDQTFQNQIVGTKPHDHPYLHGEKNDMFKSFDRLPRKLFTSYSRTEKQECASIIESTMFKKGVTRYPRVKP